MQVIALHRPTNGGTLYWGLAKSNRGRRYDFIASADGDAGSRVYREEPASALQDGRSLWLSVSIPLALRVAVRQAICGDRRIRAA